MARNKRIIQNTDEKKAEIIAAARMLFLEIGYDATSMSKLAATAKITPNKIYWYFKEKDEVLTKVISSKIVRFFRFIFWGSVTKPTLIQRL